MYYLRARPAADPIKFTVDVEYLLKSAGEIINKEQKGGIRPRDPNFEIEDQVKKRVKPNNQK